MSGTRYSYENYPPDGVTTDFTFGFDYLSKSDVRAYVDGVETAFTWVTNKTVRITPAPTGNVLQVRRYTNAATQTRRSPRETCATRRS